MIDVYIEKGTILKANVFSRSEGCLPGSTLKITGTFTNVSGPVRHIRKGPDGKIRFYIDSIEGIVNGATRPVGCICSSGHIEITEASITEVIKQ